MSANGETIVTSFSTSYRRLAGAAGWLRETASFAKNGRLDRDIGCVPVVETTDLCGRPNNQYTVYFLVCEASAGAELLLWGVLLRLSIAAFSGGISAARSASF
jgi:hypothetical protein